MNNQNLHTRFKTATLAIILIMGINLTLTFNTTAQKLPNKQETSLLAPTTIKVDGKTTELSDHFQAYNDATQIYYTLSNNKEIVYLAIQVTDPNIIRRIMNGSITLTISQAKKKSNPDDIKITYPIFDKTGRFYFTRAKNSREFSNKVEEEKSKDSIVTVNNQNYHKKEKSIKLKGFNSLDSLISIYNDDGIKAEGAFDKSLFYTYELTFPIKYLPTSIQRSGAFFYNIQINEVEQQGITVNRDETTGKIISARISAGAQTQQYATDFWAEYKLAK